MIQITCVIDTRVINIKSNEWENIIEIRIHKSQEKMRSVFRQPAQTMK